MSTQAAGNISGLLGTIVPLLLLFVVFYFFILRPQKKRDKQVKDMLSALKKGDKITTIGGIYGRIIDIQDDVVTIESGAERTQIVFARWAIKGVVGDEISNDASPED